MERYINPFTDFGFKKLFGEEANKDLLIDFLNELLGAETGLITDLTYLRNEHIGSAQEDRKAIFDLYCENQRGEKFIVELQKARQKFFKDRSLYYSTFAIQEQARIGEWDFKLQRVYTVSIMDFEFEETQADRQKFIHDIGLLDRQTSRIFSDKLRYIYLEMPKFVKQEHELETRFEKWLYLIRNLASLQDIPPRLQERIFRRVFDVAELARFSTDDRRSYHNSLKYYRDLKNVIDTAFEQGLEDGLRTGLEQGIKQGIKQGIEQGIEQGREQGIEQGREQGIEQGREQGIEQGREQGIEQGREQGERERAMAIARLMKATGEPTDKIALFTGLNPDDIDGL